MSGRPIERSGLSGRIDQVSIDDAPSPTTSARTVDRVAIVPDTGIQFVDVSLDRHDAKLVTQRFISEQPNPENPTGLRRVRLEHDGIRHPVTHAPIATSDTVAVSGDQALQAFAGRWIPLPVFRQIAHGSDGSVSFDDGPVNWARLFIEPLQGTSQDSHMAVRAVVALDTAVKTAFPGRTYPELAPEWRDVEGQTVFSLAGDEIATSEFLAEDWVAGWVEQAADVSNLTAIEGAHDVLAAAAYFTLLDLLVRANTLPEFCFAQEVDRIGERRRGSRATLTLALASANGHALLHDSHGPNGTGASSVRPLRIRDLGHPTETREDGTFSTRLTFAQAQFGPSTLSRKSGRALAFHWPSLVRIGTEAERIAAGFDATDSAADDPSDARAAASQVSGVASLDQPGRYLWDRRRSSQPWVFATDPSASPWPRQTEQTATSRPLSGPLMTHLTRNGDVLAQGQKGGRAAGSGFASEPGPATPQLGEQEAATDASFPRASLTSFAIAEVIVQAISDLYRPAPVSFGSTSFMPPDLARIVVARGCGLLPDEEAELLRRANDAVDLVWRSFGWTSPEDHSAQEMRFGGQHGRTDGPVRAKPEVVLGSSPSERARDALLHTELHYSYGGDVPRYVEALGRMRAEASLTTSVRVAALHVDDFASTLLISTHWPSESGDLAGRDEFVATLPWGRDDLLSVLARDTVPRILAAGMGVALDIPGDQNDGSTGKEPDGARVTDQQRIANALADAILDWQLERERIGNERPQTQYLRDLLGRTQPPLRVARLLSDAEEAFDVEDVGGVAIRLDPREISKTISGALRRGLGAAVEAVVSRNCDSIALSGRLSKLAGLRDLFVRELVVRPDRVVQPAEIAARIWLTQNDHNRGLLPAPPLLESMAASQVLSSQPASMPPGSDGPAKIVRTTSGGPQAFGVYLLDDKDAEHNRTSSLRSDIEAGETPLPGEDDGNQSTTSSLAYELPARPTGESSLGDRFANARDVRRWSFQSNLPRRLGVAPVDAPNWPRLPAYTLRLSTNRPPVPVQMPLRITIETEGSHHGTAFRIVEVRDASDATLPSNAIVFSLEPRSASADAAWLSREGQTAGANTRDNRP